MAVSSSRVDRPSRADSHSTVLITGGTGTLGAIVADRLRVDGYTVRVYSRHASQTRLHPDIHPVDGDIRDGDALTTALDGVDAVVHLAGILREARPYQTFTGVFLEGTHAVIGAAQRAGVSRFVHITGIGANPDSPDTFERTRGLAELETRESGLSWVILRPSVIFGVRGSMFDRLAQSLKRTWPFAIVPRKNGIYQPLWREDAASAVAIALQDDKLLGDTYELGGPDSWTYRQLVDLALRHLMVRRIVLPLPEPLLLAGAGLPRLAGRQPIVTPSELRQLTRDNRTDPSALKAMLGAEPTRLIDKVGEAFAL